MVSATDLLLMLVGFVYHSRRARIVVGVLAFVLLATAIPMKLVLAFRSDIIYREYGPNGIQQAESASTGLFLFGIVLGFLLLLSITKLGELAPRTTEKEIVELREEREDIRKRVPPDANPDIFTSTQLNLNKLSEYYAMNMQQARNSFTWSVVAVLGGLITIGSGIWLFILQEPRNLGLASLSGISGLIVEVIGGTLFVLYRRSMEQVNVFYAQLVRLQNTMLSIGLLNEIDDPIQKTSTKVMMISALMNRSDPSEFVPPLMQQRQPRGRGVRDAVTAAPKGRRGKLPETDAP